MKHPVVRRLGVLTAAATLSLGLLAPAAQADPTPSASAATSWLAGDLPATGYYSSTFEGVVYADGGLTIDTGLAALETGDAALLARVRTGLQATSPSGGTSSVIAEYAGFGANAAAKAVAFVTRIGADPRSFGGTDLVATLEARVGANGRIADAPGGTDFASTIGQAFAAEGLAAAGSTRAASVLSYLVGLQCGSGVFGSALPAVGAPASCVPEAAPGADTTSLAVLSLEVLPASAPTLTAIERAGAYLATAGSNGSYGGGAGTGGSNANSTGLAAAALGASCRVVAADQAGDRVRELQLASGAVAYDAAARAAGVTDDNRGQYRRTTNQATSGLTWDDKAPASVTITGPAAPTAPLSAQVLTVNGAAQGETICLTTPAGVQRLIGTGSPLSVKVGTPASGRAVYTATTGPGVATYTLASSVVTEVKTKKVSVGDQVKVTVAGLTAGSKVVTKIRGVKVDKTRADAAGVARVVFKLKAKVAKPGRATLKIKPAGAPAVKKSIRIVRP